MDRLCKYQIMPCLVVFRGSGENVVDQSYSGQVNSISELYNIPFLFQL